MADYELVPTRYKVRGPNYARAEVSEAEWQLAVELAHSSSLDMSRLTTLVLVFKDKTLQELQTLFAAAKEIGQYEPPEPLEVRRK